MIRGSAKSAQEALKACIDCGEVNPADIHTCSPQANRLDATVFVYRHKPTGNTVALYHEDALHAAKRNDLEHLATLEPRAWIEAHYEQVSGAADPVQEPDWEAIAADQAMTIALMRSEQEPVAWMVYTLDGKSVCVTDNPADFTDQHKALPLYTHPAPARVPLTDEQIGLLTTGDGWSHCDTPALALFARAIEHAHGIGDKA
jgi:hypothetical protein